MYDDRLLEDLLNQQAAGTDRAAPDPLRHAARRVVVAALIVAVVAGAVAGVIGGVVAGVVAFALAGILVGGGLAWVIWRPRSAELAARVGGRPADSVVDARLLNLVEGLCTVTGLRVPEVRVVEADGLNALAVGRSATSATLAVTSGLVSHLNRIELEGVLAEEVVAIRNERMVPATIAASVPPALSKLVPVQPVPELDGDRAAVALTRYPPGLIAALEKMAELGTTVPADPALDDLWLAPPRAAPGTVRLPLSERIEALAEL